MVRKSDRIRPQALVDHVAQKSVAIDSALEGALAKIRLDRKLPATQETVALLAKCSRGTVNNRPTVLSALHDIKKARRASKVVHKKASSSDFEKEVKCLKERLEKSRDVTLKMLIQRDDFKRKYEKLQANYALLAESARLLQAQLSEMGVRPLTVVPLKPAPKGR